MEWNYEDPPSKYHKLILKRYKNLTIVKESLKLWSLVGFLRKHSFKNANILRGSVLKNGKPMFSKYQAVNIFKALKQKGGKNQISEFPLVDAAVKKGVEWISGYDPTGAIGFMSNAGTNITNSVKEFEKTYPVIGLATDIAPRVLSTAADGVNEVAVDIAGPLGAAAAVVSMPLAAAAATIDAAEGDLGKAAVNLVQGVPLFGDGVANILKQAQGAADKVNESRKTLEDTPLSGVLDYIPKLEVSDETKQEIEPT